MFCIILPECHHMSLLPILPLFKSMLNLDTRYQLIVTNQEMTYHTKDEHDNCKWNIPVSSYLGGCLCIYIRPCSGGEPHAFKDVDNKMSAKWFVFVVGMLLR